MSDQFLGEIRIAAFDYAPPGWAACNGQQLLIQQNQQLFQLLKTIYGGDGVRNFNLPNIQGCAAMDYGNPPQMQSYPIGSSGGVATVALNAAQAAHFHDLVAANAP